MDKPDGLGGVEVATLIGAGDGLIAFKLSTVRIETYQTFSVNSRAHSLRYKTPNTECYRSNILARLMSMPRRVNRKLDGGGIPRQSERSRLEFAG